jgi:hypothetical protein
MIITSDKCKKCDHIVCNVKCFQQNFEKWTSNNDDIDEFIRDSQLSSHDVKKALEWIPYNRFNDTKYIAKNMYAANWIDGNIISWNNKSKNWIRKDQNMFVNMRILESKNITFKFMSEVYIIDLFLMKYL